MAAETVAPAWPAPALPGDYALELVLAAPARLSVGALGSFIFPSGIYVYLGSARGPGGLRARLARHLRPWEQIRPHWHIDYLRRMALVTAVAYRAGPPDGLECRWSQALAGLPGACIPARGFGAADCRSGCMAHLAGFPGRSLGLLEAARLPGDPYVFRM